MSKRDLDVVILSDIHLGTADCQAEALLNYLRDIRPETLILNGDIVHMSHRKKIFPAMQMKVIDEILQLSMKGTSVYLITGNRDDELRRFSPFTAGNFKLRDKLVLQLKGKQYWIFHGDIFDLSGAITPWLVQWGSNSYRYLLRANRWVNHFRKSIGKPEMSLSTKLRKWPLKAKRYIDHFESQALRLAKEQGYDYVICGHTHQPVIRNLDGVTYMNSGDWVENMTALEFNFGKWKLYRYNRLDFEYVNPKLRVPVRNSTSKMKDISINSEELFQRIISQVKH